MTTSRSEKKIRNILGCNEDRSMAWIHVRAVEGAEGTSFQFKKTEGDMFEIDFFELLKLWCDSATPRSITRTLAIISKSLASKMGGNP